MAEWCWVDGVEGGSVPADDRGLNLADGVFETLRIELGRLVRPRLHRNRLARGLSVLGFPAPAVLASQVLKSAAHCCADKLGLGSGSLRLTVTRGSGPRGYAPPPSPIPRVVLRVSDTLPQEGEPMTLMISSIPWARQPILAGCKLLARTEQVWALQEANRHGFEDAVMLNVDGNWQSTCSGNLFVRMGDTLFTPPVDAEGVAGTRRRAILDHWAQAVGLEVYEEPLTERLVTMAEEAFSCNSLVGVRSIASVGTLRFSSMRAAGELKPLIHRKP